MKRHKRKNSSDYTVERVYNFILNCGGIASGSVIAKALHISESWAHQCAREAIRKYGDIESVSGVGYRKKGIEYSYMPAAALFSGDDECIYGWEGPIYTRMSDINKAREWYPPIDDLDRQIALWRATHPTDTIELVISIFDGDDEEIECDSEVVG